MPPTLLESNRSFLRSAECTVASVLAHAVLLCFVAVLTQGSSQIPTDEREARVFFLLPPDRVDVRVHQTEVFQLGELGADLESGKHLTQPGEGRRIRETTYGARTWGERSGAKGKLPFGPMAPYVPDTVFSVLEVDEMVERFENSAAPIYPQDLLAVGAEGLVQMIYVVDTAGVVDTTTIQVVSSDDPRFTQSVRTALAGMRFRPAKRGGKVVRQQVQQQFRFRILPPAPVAEQTS